MAHLLFGFASPEALQEAARRLRVERLGAVETYTPVPLTGGGSWIPWLILAAGMLGATGAFLLQSVATVWSDPLNVGGRPDFSWPAFMPMALESGLLCGVVAGVIGFLVAARLPMPYRPVDEAETFRRASRDLFFVALRSGNAAALAHARALLHDLRPAVIEEVAA
ncbi:putative ABC-type Fe3+ transport system protein; Molybdenum transport protein [Rhodovastum atsumiense]|uniref:DUF3341 domain-containing protein n=1 Tax=Rhodovastum atsumiense TaxID=504468 RepID=A0A5M6IY50_9PROT|nr:DUF3341 domain-containing protein [Rhodovastum atsumiense]KAA5613242.1 DUF3341 domain-containing protein [Rhodovastum atsumiense]CAH2600601.1 putative ABC-type Fe3+ transport system protein; Molybdenum transport protein [Rhodovastum atsumiense]